MRLTYGQIWRCINETCAAQIQVTIGSNSASEGSNPRCSCGSPMKKPYAKPQLQQAVVPPDVRQLLEKLQAVLR